MNIQISTVTMRYDADKNVSGVQVHFSGSNDGRTININGYIPLSAEEYAGNESLTALEGIVKQQVADRLLED